MRLRGNLGGSTWPLSAPSVAHVQDTLPLLTAMPTPACASPQPGAETGTGTLPLCGAVMRFLLGCLHRKSQPEDAKSLSEPWQPPAAAHPGASGGAPTPAPIVQPVGHWHQLQLGAPAVLAAPTGCTSQQLCYLFTLLPPSQPHAATSAATAPLGWGCQAHLWGPRAA